MKKVMMGLVLAALMVGCASSESQIKETLKKNPQLVFDVIEENPEQFIKVINVAAQKAQESQYEKRIAQMKTEQEKELLNPKKPKLAADRRLIGNDSAKIVIVEYADFQCPACQMAYKSLKEFKEKYKGQVQFYYKNMPLDFHKMAYPAALYFEAMKIQDKNKALKFYEYVFENQRGLVSEDFLKKAAKQMGADMKRLDADMKSDKVKALIEEDMAEFQEFGFTGTPMVLINGVSLSGAQGIEELERVAKLTMKK